MTVHGVWGTERAGWISEFSNRSVTGYGVWGRDSAVWMAVFSEQYGESALCVWERLCMLDGWVQ